MLHSKIDISRCLKWSPTPATFCVNAAHKSSTRHRQNYIRFRALDNTVKNNLMVSDSNARLGTGVARYAGYGKASGPCLVRSLRQYLTEPAIYHVQRETQIILSTIDLMDGWVRAIECQSRYVAYVYSCGTKENPSVLEPCLACLENACTIGLYSYVTYRLSG